MFFAGAILLFLRRNEDNWICENNAWVKHGNPAAEKPDIPCGSATPTAVVSQTSRFKIYFGNKNNQKEADVCIALSVVEREMPFSVAVVKDSIDELLKGPSEEEISEGYYTNINKGVALQKISFKDGIIKVDFDETLEKGIGGSCKVAFIRSQIVETLKQFPDVREVIISINGKTEDILQP